MDDFEMSPMGGQLHTLLFDARALRFKASYQRHMRALLDGSKFFRTKRAFDSQPYLSLQDGSTYVPRQQDDHVKPHDWAWGDFDHELKPCGSEGYTEWAMSTIWRKEQLLEGWVLVNCLVPSWNEAKHGTYFSLEIGWPCGPAPFSVAGRLHASLAYTPRLPIPAMCEARLTGQRLVQNTLEPMIYHIIPATASSDGCGTGH